MVTAFANSNLNNTFIITTIYPSYLNFSFGGLLIINYYSICHCFNILRRYNTINCRHIYLFNLFTRMHN